MFASVKKSCAKIFAPVAKPPNVIPETLRCRLCGELKTATNFSLNQRRLLKNSVEKVPDAKLLCRLCAKRAKDKEAPVMPVPVRIRAETGLPFAQLQHQEDDAAFTTALYCDDPSQLPTGLRYFADFLDVEEERKIIDTIDARSWCSAIARRQQFYGTVYYHTAHEVSSLQPEEYHGAEPDESDHLEKVEYESEHQLTSSSQRGQSGHHPRVDLDWLVDKFYGGARVPSASGELVPTDGRRIVPAEAVGRASIFGSTRSAFPSQILVNEYRGNAGISTHFEDSTAFGGVIGTVSLLSPVYLTLERPLEKISPTLLARVKVLLEPRSLLVLEGEARRDWRHGITGQRRIGLPDGSVVRRGPEFRRVSLTIRHLLAGRRRVPRI